MNRALLLLWTVVVVPSFCIFPIVRKKNHANPEHQKFANQIHEEIRYALYIGGKLQLRKGEDIKERKRKKNNERLIV